ncbi:MFS transporter [Virgibacillus pantothenticus]|uniref:MFS transporter n=1 Tax=Virgibacillus pantothenticus TaxID=1473 RepID=A0A0L0QTU4_VIRPA|nr:MFS transporter [Virgibacillus pantothenticus]KNE21947.1 MFS transporter [Virgibacillus pantothenticus]MED3735287.1 MFS transporter [Virgibacillus pantothenticus]QTY17191.1 MFS transporter [Virgibacillus pantothenticus]SIS89731.1 Major Facilitator Superfamily protein [Virgibacillus pantothenticus]
MKTRNFILLISGRIVTNIGDSLYAVASMWLVYELTKNNFFTGLAGFLTAAPIALQFFIGPIIDRIEHRSILIYSQMLQAVLLAVIPLAYYFDVLYAWIVLTICPLASIIQQFVYPTHFSILPKIVDKDSLTKANSFMTSTYQLLDLILMGVSGVIIAIMGAVAVYMLDAIAFLIAMTLFYYLKFPGTKNVNVEAESKFSLKEEWSSYKLDLKEGYSFIRRSFIPKFLLAAIIANFVIGGVSAILPDYAANRGGSHIYGWYLGAMSGGLLAGSFLANVFNKIPLGRVTIIGFFISGLSWIFSGVTNITILSILLFGISYISIGLTNVLFLSSLQNILPSEVLGRVFSFVAGATMIASPLGSLIGGSIATFTGSFVVFMSGSLGILFVSLYWIIIPKLRNLPSPADFGEDGTLMAKQS